MGHIGDGFLQVKWPNQQCQSTEGSSSPKHRLQSHQVHLTILQTYACMQYSVIHNTKMNLSTVKWAQWDKNQSRELLVCSYVCALHCAELLHTILHRTDLIISAYTPDNHHCSDDVLCILGYRSMFFNVCEAAWQAYVLYWVPSSITVVKFFLWLHINHNNQPL